MKHLEDNEQILLFEWATLQSCKYPELELLFHIPNGGKRNAQEAARFKRMGVKPGVPDLMLPVPRNGYHGLWIEMKSPKGKTSKNQKDMLEKLNKQRYKAVVCFSWEEAAQIIKDYLEE